MNRSLDALLGAKTDRRIKDLMTRRSWEPMEPDPPHSTAQSPIQRLSMTLLLTSVRGRRLELLELATLLWLMPQWVTSLGLAGLGALALGEAIVALTCATFVRLTGARRPSAVLAAACAFTVAVAVVFVGDMLSNSGASTTAWIAQGESAQPMDSGPLPSGALPSWLLATVCLVSLGAGPRLRTMERLARAATGTVRVIRGGAALARLLAVAALLPTATQTDSTTVVVIAAVWLAIDVFAAGLARAGLPHKADGKAYEAAKSAEPGAETLTRHDDISDVQTLGSPATTTTRWHLDEILIAALIGVAAVTPWAVGAWISGRLMGLSALLEEAALPLPLPRVPDGHAWRRSFDATLAGATVIAVPMLVFSGVAARTWLQVDAPWLGLFGVVFLVAAAGRATRRGVALTVRKAAALPAVGPPRGARSLDRWHLAGAIVGLTVLGPPGVLLATIAILATQAARDLQRVHTELPLARAHLLPRLTALVGPALGGLLVGVTLLTAKPPRTAMTTLAEVAITTILTAVAAFATYQITGRK